MRCSDQNQGDDNNQSNDCFPAKNRIFPRFRHHLARKRFPVEHQVQHNSRKKNHCRRPMHGFGDMMNCPGLCVGGKMDNDTRRNQPEKREKYKQRRKRPLVRAAFGCRPRIVFSHNLRVVCKMCGLMSPYICMSHDGEFPSRPSTPLERGNNSQRRRVETDRVHFAESRIFEKSVHLGSGIGVALFGIQKHV